MSVGQACTSVIYTFDLFWALISGGATAGINLGRADLALFSPYRKLLGDELGVEDLRHLHPAVYSNLIKLRTYGGSFEDLGLVFQVHAPAG